MPTHYEGTPEEINALNAFIKLTRAADTLFAHLTQRKSMGNLTVRQFGVLESLYHLGPMRQGEISAKLLKSGGNITLVVDNLEKSGLVLRTRDTEDRRAVTVSLTEEGRELIAGLFPGMSPISSENFPSLRKKSNSSWANYAGCWANRNVIFKVCNI